jgi:hypothetical protein
MVDKFRFKSVAVNDKQNINKEREDSIQKAIKFGIDVSLLYERIEMTYTERIERHQQMINFVEELKRAGAKKHGKY